MDALARRRLLAVLPVFCMLGAFPAVTRGAPNVGRKLVLVAPIVADPKLTLPGTYSADALKREMEVALESTGLFSAVTRAKAEVDPVIAERRQARQGSTPFHEADLVLNPTLEGFDLAERRRLAPMMRTKDAVSVRGSLSMTVEVIDVHGGGVQTRMQIDVVYKSPEHLEDPLVDDPLHGAGDPSDRDAPQRADHAERPPTPEELKIAYEAMGRAFANRVVEQVSPTQVAARDGDQLFLTRGEDAGYQVGDTLRIMRLGAPVVNPVTHEVLGNADEQIGEAKVVEVRPRLTVARIVRAAKEVAVGDIVRMPVASGADN